LLWSCQTVRRRGRQRQRGRREYRETDLHNRGLTRRRREGRADGTRPDGERLDQAAARDRGHGLIRRGPDQTAVCREVLGTAVGGSIFGETNDEELLIFDMSSV
jgi:hypothetical protein